jgi:hypothetical protein
MAVIVVAAVVIIAILFLAGVVFHKSNATTTEPYATFDEATSVAGTAASHAATGTWSPVFAAGLRLSSSLTVPVSNLTTLTNLTSNCTFSAVSGSPTSITIDATPSSTPQGHGAFWLLGLSNGGGSILLVSVDLGTATALLLVSGASCAQYTDLLAPFPSTESDSPALVAAANASGGSGFLAQYPGAVQLLAGLGGLTDYGFTSSPEWEVFDTSCPVPLLVNETGMDFNATLTGNPATVQAHSTGPVNCSFGLSGLSTPLPLVTDFLDGLSKSI